MSESETIGKRIKRERMSRSLTQRELAEKVGVGVPHISKIEADREQPSDELLARFATTFDLDAGELSLVARRVPDDLLEKLAGNPQEGLAFLRKWAK